MISALALALMLQAAAPAWYEEIEPTEWRFLGSTTDLTGAVDSVAYTRPAIAAAGYRRIWVRFEDRDGPRRSAVFLMEFDCAQQRSRPLQSMEYVGRNMGGEVVTKSQPGSWTYATPGTIGEAELKRACASATSAPASAPQKARR